MLAHLHDVQRASMPSVTPRWHLFVQKLRGELGELETVCGELRSENSALQQAVADSADQLKDRSAQN